MRITLSDEQTMLGDSVARWLEAKATAVAPQGQDLPLDPTLWREIAGLGWLGAGVTEAAGGFGGPREMAVVIQAVGRTRLAEPVMAGFLALAILEQAAPQHPLIADVIAGDVCASGVTADMAGSLVFDAGASVLSGHLAGVWLPEGAARIVLALPGATLVVDPALPGVDCHRTRALDGVMRSNLTFAGLRLVPDAVLATGAAAAAVLDRAVVAHATLITAECSGLAARQFTDTLAYLNQREQFGQAIGRFQAIQHRMADMFIALEELRSLALVAVRAAEANEAPSRALSQAVSGAVDRALHVAKEAIQLHGGVGMTEDLPLGAGLRRVKLLQLRPGGAETHRRRLLTPAA